MISPLSFLSPWFRASAVIAVLVAGLAGAPARASSGYKDIAYFEEGTVATLSIVVEYKGDGDRSTNIRFNRSPLGSSMFFHSEQWKKFWDNLRRVKDGPDGTEQTFADIDTPGGSFLRMSAIRHGDQVNLTLINQSHPGDSYPPVPFHLAPEDFENLLKAMVAATKADIIVSAKSAADFARFRADVGRQLTPEQLQDFDTAISELQLDAQYRGIATEAGREADMLAVANRKLLPDVVVLGWRARKDRLIREIPKARKVLDDVTAEATKTAATGTPPDVTLRLAAAKEALSKARRERDNTLHHLPELSEIIMRANLRDQRN